MTKAILYKLERISRSHRGEVTACSFKKNCDHSSFIGNNHSDYMRAEANGENVQHRVAARDRIFR